MTGGEVFLFLVGYHNPKPLLPLSRSLSTQTLGAFVHNSLCHFHDGFSVITSFSGPKLFGSGCFNDAYTGASIRPNRAFQAGVCLGLSVWRGDDRSDHPYQRGLMAVLAISGINFDKWFKFAIKLVLVIMAVSAIALVVAISINL